MSETAGRDDEEKRSAREPEGPAHPRREGIGQTLKRTATEFSEDQLTDGAAALTYYGVLSLFPGLIAVISIIGLVGNPQKIISGATDIVQSVAPSISSSSITTVVQSLASSSGTGIALIVGFVGALWSASGYVGGFIRASNRIHEAEEGRSVFLLRPLQLLVTLVLVVLCAVILAALVVSGSVATQIGSMLGLGSTVVTVWNYVKLPVIALIVLFMLALLYYSAPNARLPGFKSVLPGALLALVVWIIASVGFAFYVANFGSYNKTYGALAGVIVFLVWLWITNVAVLFGAEFNAERERSRQIAEGVPGAERELQTEPRKEPKEKKKSRTA